MDARSDGLTLQLTRVFRAVPSVVFEAFSDPGELAKWWGPQGFTIPALVFEPRARKRYRIDMQPPEGDAFALVGEFREVDPPSRLADTFMWEDPTRTTSRHWSCCRFAPLAQPRRSP